MALHGAPGSYSADAPPRVHHVTPRAGLPLLPRRSPAEVVSLGQPRPDGERVTNDYVETPLRGGEPGPPPRPGRAPPVPPLVPGLAHRTSTASAPSSRLPLPTAVNNKRGGGVVTKQPTSLSSFKKETRPTSSESQPCTPPVGSIMCPVCSKCTCDACREPLPMPARWLCNNTVYCSPEATVDYITCLCCAKAVFYHCSKDCDRDDGSAPCADEPCSCAPPRRCARWGCLAALSVALPCLLCYWPLRAALAGVEACHASATSNRGCRCQPRAPSRAVSVASSASTNKSLLDGSAADKRLLDSSPDA